ARWWRRWSRSRRAGCPGRRSPARRGTPRGWRRSGTRGPDPPGSRPTLAVLDERLGARAQEEAIEVIGARQDRQPQRNPEDGQGEQVQAREVARHPLLQDEHGDRDVLGDRLRLP